MKYLVLFFFASLFASCASLSVPSTGFLKDREQLTRNTDHEVWGIPDEVELYVSSDLDASNYDSVWVEETVYRPNANPAYEPTPEAIDGLRADFTERLGNALGQDFQLVDQPGPRTLRVRAAIAEVACERVWLNIIGVIAILPVSMGGISGQIEIIDSQSGKRLIAMAAHRDGSPFLVLECFSKYAHARWGMRKWSSKMRAILEQSRAVPIAE